MTAFALQPEYIRDKTYTVEEYFELEKNSDIRHEFVNGKLIAIPGESVIANRIADNCGFNLRLHLNIKGYDTIRHDVRTMIRNGKLYRYPDVSVAKRSEITQTHAVTKPEMLIEVTSENSSTTDHDAKVKEYTGLPSLQYYLIVSQEEMLVEVYSRDNYGWRFDIYAEPTDVIPLNHFGCSLSLADIYENVIWTDNKSDA
jgi:Uma2 family endonuclease